MLTFLVCCFLLVLCGEQKKVSGTVIASDKRVKVNVAQADIGSFYSQIQKVQLHKYDYVSDHFRRNRRFNGTQVGFIAQELKEVIPESVATVPTLKLRKGAYGTDETELNEFHVVDNDVVFTVNVGATQELIQRSESLETQLVVITKNYSDMATQLHLLDKHLNQEVSQQLIEKRKTAEAEVSKAELQIQLEKEQAAAKLKLDLATLEAQAKEDRSMADKKAEIERKNADYADGLARKRLDKQNTDATQRQKVEHERARERNSELVKMQEEAQQRAEDARLAHELEIEKQKAKYERETAADRARIDAEARIKQERENEDVQTRKLKAQWAAETERWRQSIVVAFETFAAGAATFLQSPQQLARTVGFIAAVATAIYLTREVVRVIGIELSKRLSRPSLIRESSKDPIGCQSCLARIFCCCMCRKKSGDDFAGIILHEKLDSRIHLLAQGVRNTRRHSAPMRHMLFYGPPGTGKSMVAKRLAVSSGLDWAIMSGGDVGPLGKDAVTEIHNIFKWAKNSSHGLILFIDEAEAFLSRREKDHSENIRNAVSALLYHTGSQQSNFMLIMATNLPDTLDTAIVDRLDEHIRFPKPNLVGRQKLLTLYFKKHMLPRPKRSLLSRRTASPITMDKDVNVELVVSYAAKMAGFSGREISKCMLGLQAKVYGQEKCHLTKNTVMQHMAAVCDQHRKMKLFVQMNNVTTAQEEKSAEMFEQIMTP